MTSLNRILSASLTTTLLAGLIAAQSPGSVNNAKDLDSSASVAGLDSSAGTKGLDQSGSTKPPDNSAGNADLDKSGSTKPPDNSAGNADLDTSGSTKPPDNSAGNADLDTSGSTKPPDNSAGNADLDTSGSTKPPDSSAKQWELYDESGAACISVQPYGQRSGGEDMAKYGKTLRISFRANADKSGSVDVAGPAGQLFGVILASRRAEIRLPWGDTLLVQNIIAVGSGKFDGAGRGKLGVDLTAVASVAQQAHPAQLEFYIQAVAVDAKGQPLTSQGLKFELCGSSEPAEKGSFGLDTEVASFSRKQYSSHAFGAQLLQGIIGSQGWSVLSTITLPHAGWNLQHDGMMVKGDVLRVLLSVRAPADPRVQPPVHKSLTVKLGSATQRRIEVFIADRVDGVPPEYKIGAYLSR